MTATEPIIVGGCYRSGTSLLRRMLDAHSRIHCGPEVKFFRDFYNNYLDDPLKRVRFFSSVRSIGLDESELLSLYGGAFIEAHERAARRLGKARWADKNPENVLYADRWNELLGGGMYFVHVVRDPLDTLASMVEAKFDRAVPADFDGKIAVYGEYVKHGLSYEERHPEHSVRVRYEELVTEPRSVLEALLERIGEVFEPAMVTDYNAEERQAGIEDPKVKSTKNINAESVGRGRRDLSKKEVRAALSELGPFAKLLGYTYDDGR